MRTITAPKEIDRLFAGGRRVSHPALLVLALPTPEARDPSGRVLFVAGTRLGGAVTRNRSKRVLRESVRRVGGPWPGWDVALMARAGTEGASSGDLDAAVRRAIDSLGIT
ncbi:MAG: ribonuclease P protein component [Coriobacteriia bacterium]